MSKLMRIVGLLVSACALARASSAVTAQGSFSCDVGEEQCCANVYSVRVPLFTLAWPDA